MKFNKIITILVVILVILLAMIAGVYIYKSQNNASTGETSTENNIGLADKVTDECVEEWEEMQNDLNRFSNLKYRQADYPFLYYLSGRS